MKPNGEGGTMEEGEKEERAHKKLYPASPPFNPRPPRSEFIWKPSTDRNNVVCCLLFVDC
jgi:hypothetical protein